VINIRQNAVKKDKEWQSKGWYNDIKEMVLKASEKEGWMFLFNGVLPAYVLTINPAIQTSIYDGLAEGKKRITRLDYLSHKDIFIFSALSKLIASLFTYPLTLVKTRLYVSRIQTSPGNIGSGNSTLLVPSNATAIPPKLDIIFSLRIEFLKFFCRPLNIQSDGVMAEIRNIYEKEGLIGFYRGVVWKSIQNILMAIIMILCKENIYYYTRRLYSPKKSQPLPTGSTNTNGVVPLKREPAASIPTIRKRQGGRVRKTISLKEAGNFNDKSK
jgi:hypothetical protein